MSANLVPINEPDQNIMSVLMAEDDDDDFELLVEAINSLSLKVTVSRAENGDILMRILHEATPDLLFLDIMMPCKDGKDCILEIRSHRKFDNLPIIIYSSVKDLSTIEFCYRNGTNLYAIKPNSYAELVNVIERIFSIDWRTMRYYPRFENYLLGKR